jgi:hypothetical protein
LFLDNNEITDLKVLVEMAESDAAGDQRFSPFWRIYTAGNPLGDDVRETQLPRIKELGGRVSQEPTPH